ncbi:MAG TPA: amidohydrolase family protein [Candidatus Limnocylindrales bacterium]|nr:amidohydrolase family protein [Candidatus Limnocylindrales bacterium]
MRIPVLLALAAFVQQSESPLTVLPPDVPKDATMRTILLDGTPSGQDAVWKGADGALHEFFQFNDRGRGPKLYLTYSLDSGGSILKEESKGVDYMKQPVDEKFSEAKPDGFYVALNGAIEGDAIMARALLAKGGKLALLPSGEARIRRLQPVTVTAGGKTRTAILYEISGMAFTPSYLWLTEDRQFFAAISESFATVQNGFERTVPTLRDAQRAAEANYSAELAKNLTHKPDGPLVISGATVFDSEFATERPNLRVTIRGERIESVEPERGQALPAGAQAIDAKGKMLMPGLWDMHNHLDGDLAFLDIATGITSARDLGNSIEELTHLRQAIADGNQIGPRIVPAGFIDGPGPFQAPIKVLAATAEEARQWVDRYADLGYVQIKIYSSVKPELVPVIVQEAHKRGLRVSGHVPAGMIAEQFVRDGADEIQHMNFIFLNFMPDVKETRTPARFVEPGKRGGDLDVNSPAVEKFIQLLKERHTVVDPTMGAWEGMYIDRPGKPSHIDAPMFDRLPVQVRRAAMTGSGAPGAEDPATDAQYRRAYANMLRMLKKLYDSGVTIVAGTDAGSGYAFDRELEIYTEAGIPAAKVLQIATLGAARVMHLDRNLGSIAPGKLADLILVDGDPAARISDIRKVETVVKGGMVYRPAELDRAFGIRP